MYKLAYLNWAIIFLPVWLLIFFLRKDLRKNMVVFGILFAVLAPIGEFIFFLRDYWTPLKFISIQSFISQEFVFVFLLTGIVLFSYPSIFRKSIGHELNWKKIIVILIIAGLPLGILTFLFRVKSIVSLFIGQILVGLFILLQKPKLVNVAAFNFIFGIILGFMGFFIFMKLYPNIINDWWLTNNLFGIFIARIPIEEIVWLGFCGLGFGLIPEFALE